MTYPHKLTEKNLIYSRYLGEGDNLPVGHFYYHYIYFLPKKKLYVLKAIDQTIWDNSCDKYEYYEASTLKDLLTNAYNVQTGKTGDIKCEMSTNFVRDVLNKLKHDREHLSEDDVEYLRNYKDSVDLVNEYCAEQQAEQQEALLRYLND